MRRLLVLPLAVFAVVIVAACGSDASGIDACRKIETARCQAAPACKIDISVPPSVSDDVDGCISFYKDACLHGLEVADPGGPVVDACVKAIQQAGALAPSTSCFTVAHPETNASCSWLVPTAVVDAGTDADDGSVDAADAAAAIDAD